MTASFANTWNTWKNTKRLYVPTQKRGKELATDSHGLTQKGAMACERLCVYVAIIHLLVSIGGQPVGWVEHNETQHRLRVILLCRVSVHSPQPAVLTSKHQTDAERPFFGILFFDGPAKSHFGTAS